MGARQAGNEKAASWAEAAGQRAQAGTFAEVAAFGEVLVNATAGTASLDALAAAGHENLKGKVLIDVASPLDFSAGMPPTLAFCNTESLGERIQAAFPDVRVIKALNTMNADVMVDPSIVAGPHNVFVSGDDDGAKMIVVDLLESFGWPPGDIVDLGDIPSARGAEMYLPLWLRLLGTVGSAHFNIRVAGPA